MGAHNIQTKSAVVKNSDGNFELFSSVRAAQERDNNIAKGKNNVNCFLTKLPELRNSLRPGAVDHVYLLLLKRKKVPIKAQ